MRASIVVLAFAIVVPGCSRSSARKPLDGSTWTIVVTPDAEAVSHGAKPFDDVFVFAEGRVSMTECAKYGFEPSRYSTAQWGERAWSFETRQTSLTDGRAEWSGNAREDSNAIHGRLVWTKLDGAALHYEFSGTNTKR